MFRIGDGVGDGIGVSVGVAVSIDVVVSVGVLVRVNINVGVGVIISDRIGKELISASALLRGSESATASVSGLALASL